MASRREVINTGRRLIERILSKSSTLVSVIDENWLIPTLLIIISISFHSERIRCMQLSSASLSLTSTLWNIDPVAFAVSCPAISFISQKATWSPDRQKASTIALPIPSAPPVINTLLLEGDDFEVIGVHEADSAGWTVVDFFLPYFCACFQAAFLASYCSCCLSI